jgi:hypothetical protein
MTHAWQKSPVWRAVLYRSAGRFFDRKTLAFLGRIFGVRVFGKSVESNRFLELPFPAFPSLPSPRSQAQVPFSKPMPEENLTRGTVPGFSRGPRPLGLSQSTYFVLSVTGTCEQLEEVGG